MNAFPAPPPASAAPSHNQTVGRRALALGGTVRMSQLQLLQPFLSMLAAAVLLHVALDSTTLLFAGAVLGVVFLARRMPVHAARKPSLKRS